MINRSCHVRGKRDENKRGPSLHGEHGPGKETGVLHSGSCVTGPCKPSGAQGGQQ